MSCQYNKPFSLYCLVVVRLAVKSKSTAQSIGKAELSNYYHAVTSYLSILGKEELCLRAELSNKTRRYDLVPKSLLLYIPALGVNNIYLFPERCKEKEKLQRNPDCVR